MRNRAVVDTLLDKLPVIGDNYTIRVIHVKK